MTNESLPSLSDDTYTLDQVKEIQKQAYLLGQRSTYADGYAGVRIWIGEHNAVYQFPREMIKHMRSNDLISKVFSDHTWYMVRNVLAKGDE